MRRRDFIKGLALASLAQTLSAQKAGLAAGIQLYAVREPLAADAPATLRALSRIGFREVEAYAGTRYQATELRTMADDAGLRIPSAHLDLTMTNDLGPAFAYGAALQVEWAVSAFLRQLTDPGRTSLGNSTVRQAALPPLGADGFKRMAARMNEIGRRAKAEGFKYAYHNHNFEFERMPDGNTGYALLLRETDPALVKFEIDCGWMVVAGEKPTDYFQRFPGRFRMLHIKDFQKTAPTIDMVGPGRPKGTELGHGMIDYTPILQAARGAGIVHVYAEQEEPYIRPQLDSAKISYEYLQRFL